MGHKHVKSTQRVQRDQILKRKNIEARKRRWDKNRKKWAEDLNYQKKQDERLKILEAKANRAKNIEEGILAKARAKKLKADKKKRLLDQNKRRWRKR